MEVKIISLVAIVVVTVWGIYKVWRSGDKPDRGSREENYEIHYKKNKNTNPN